eukprot:scaffold9460_cov43-Attheya_sp.AAC.1
MMSCRTVSSIVIVVTAVILGWLNAGGVADGTLPLFHLLESHGFSDGDIPDLSGRTALVTGASSGLGLGVARSLARHGATVVVTARSKQKCTETLADITNHAPDNDHVSCEILELLSLEQVRSASTKIQSMLPTLDMLVLNAGIMAPPSLLMSQNGLEEQFQVNHLSQFHLFQTLVPSLEASAAPRVVFVSSLAHYFAPSQPLLTKELLNDEDSYDPGQWYGWSKLCNVWTSGEVNRRFPNIVSHAIHPGGVQGKLLRYSGLSSDAAKRLEHWLYWDNDTAALTVLGPLLSEKHGKEGGKYFVPIARERKTSKMGDDDKLASQLWEFSEKLLEEKI